MSQSREMTDQLERSRAQQGGLYEALVRRLLRALQRGRLVCITPDGRQIEHEGKLPGPAAQLHIRHWRALRALLLGGDTGLAESYIEGDWTSPDLAAFLTLGALNQDSGAAWAGSWPAKMLRRLHHARHANTRAGSERNIRYHYDLGNAFYAQWLDAEMVYSSALFETPHDTLETAQAQKLDLVQNWLDVPGDGSVLEIGCGWGALAARLAASGAMVTGLTLSPAQHAYASAKLAAAELAGRAQLFLRDYRDEAGTYDRIVSIEMLEAVGEAYWPDYFRTLRARLKSGGRAVLQVISIEAARFDDYRRNPDFIQRHVFPGGMLPPKAAITAQAHAAGLTLGRVRHFGASYARTLAAWRTRFTAAWPALEASGHGTEFRRLWEYYLCYCEAGFRTGIIDVGLYELHG